MSFLGHPYSEWSPASLLSHLRDHTAIRCFPVVVDEAEITRDKIDAILENRFDFNGETHSLSCDLNWTENPSVDTEWLIMLHKFYYAVGLGIAFRETRDTRYLEKWIELTESWIASVPVGFLSSDVTGRRIQNWVFAYYYFITTSADTLIPAEFHFRLLESLSAQTAWLRRHLTPARNHRTLELCAIFMVAVVFPELRDAAEWLRFTVAELLENMRSDLLPDGVQCELSTDYHHVVLRNYLVARRLARLNGIDFAPEADAHIRRALSFAQWAHRPDGLIPSLSDGDSGSYLDLLLQGYELYADPELLYAATEGRRGRAPVDRVRAFPESGYYVLRSGWGDAGEKYSDERYLIFDCGPLGAGNHGHLDVLHFEAYAYGRPLIVDPGRYTYHEGAPENWRVLFRGTSYHNTVTVDGRNQTRYEFDKTRFKIRGDEPQRDIRSFVAGTETDYIRAICRTSEYDAVHERRIVFVRGEYWIVSDFLSAPELHDYDLWFHLSPEAQEQVAVSRNRVEAPFIVIAQPAAAEPTVSVTPGFISPRYGVKYPSPIVRFHRHARSAVFHTVLVPHRGVQPNVAFRTAGDEQLFVTINRGAQVCRDTVRFDHEGNVSLERQAWRSDEGSALEVMGAGESYVHS